MRHIFLSIICLMACAAQAQDINQVLKSIEQNNASLKALREKNGAEVAEAEGRNTLAGPSLEFSPFMKKGYSGMSSSEFIAQQEFDSPSLYRQRRTTARAINAVGDAEYNLARRELLWSAQQQLISLVLLKKNHELLTDRLDISKKLLELYEKKYAAGDATAIDLNKIKLDCVARQTELDKNEAERTKVENSIRVMLCGKDMALDNLTYPAEHAQIELDTIVSQRLRNDAWLQALLTQKTLTGSLLAEARKQTLPKWSVGLRYNTEEGNGSTGVLVGVSLPLYSNKHQVRAAKARQQSYDFAHQQAREELLGEMRSQAAAFRSYQRALSNYDLSLLSQSLRLLRKAVEAGEVAVTEYYTEVDRIYDEYMTYNTLEHDCQLLHASIHRNEL